MSTPRLSKREQQIMEVVYRDGEASVTAVWQAIPDAPSRTAVRTLLRILEEKGHLKHRVDGREFIYASTRPRRRAGKAALGSVINTFFGGSLEEAVVAHLSDPKAKLSSDELNRLKDAIDSARRRGQ